MSTVAMIKLSIALFGVLCIGLVYMAVNNDPERDESVRQIRKRLKDEAAVRSRKKQPSTKLK